VCELVSECELCVCQYMDIVDPVLNSIEAITQHSLRTLSALATTATASDTDAFFHTLEASFHSLYMFTMRYG